MLAEQQHHAHISWGTRVLGPRNVSQPSALLATIIDLQTAISDSRRVHWVARGDLGSELAGLLEHLPPPAEGGGIHADAWRNEHSYGALFERLGPGFILIRERRSGREGAIFNVRDPNLLSCISRLRVPSAHLCDTCAPLIDEGLVLRCDAHSIYLPFRLKLPPTPFLAI